MPLTLGRGHPGMLSRYDDMWQFFKENPHLCCDHLASYLVIYAIDLEVDEVGAVSTCL